MSKRAKMLKNIRVLFLLSGLALAGCSSASGQSSSAAPEVSQVEEAAEDAAATEETAKSEAEFPAVFTPEVTVSFSTIDIEGNPVTEDIMKDAKVVMINFWEPWCGPCVGEMPELEKLYENYKDQGLLLIGVFTTAEMEEDAKQILADNGISYPILYSDPGLEKFMTEYVPTTIFADSEGHVLSAEPVIGANSYEGWEQIVKDYLN